ncbi:Purine permease 3, partial [Bienertia sinuspersici]
MESKEMRPQMKKFMLVLNCLMLAIGTVGGPLVTRLYYQHGGKSIWLSSWLQTGGWPLMILPLLVAYFRRRGAQPQLFFINFNTFCYAFVIVSTSSLILATQLAFTAVVAFVLVKQKFTPYSINAIALLTFGAGALALHASNERPAAESRAHYYLGWSLTFAASALLAIVLPLYELTYKKAKQTINYTLVLEIQLVSSFSATVFCTVGMLVSGDYMGYATELEDYQLGKVMYFMVSIFNAIIWQLFFLGVVGVIYYGSSLLSGVIIALALPITEVGAVILFHEAFQAEKGVSLILSLWGFVSYFYGEAKQMKKQKKREKMNDTIVT